MNTVTRLQEFQLFSPEVIDEISQAAAVQRQRTYHGFFEFAGVPEKQTYATPEDDRIELYDILPRVEGDDKTALVIRLAMAQPLDGNQTYQIATLAATNPEKRILVAANPSMKRFGEYGRLKHAERKDVAEGNFQPVAEPLLRYAASQGIATLEHVGYSYGSDVAVASTLNDSFDHKGLLVVEPASIVPRCLVALTRAFASTAKQLSHYYEANELPAYDAARDPSVSTYGMSYNAGLANLTSIAAARGIACGNFFEVLKRAVSIDGNAELDTTVAWGSRSELAIDRIMQIKLRSLRHEVPQARLNHVRLPGEYHALANDVHLFAALVRQYLPKTV